MDVLENPLYLGKRGTRTLFSIEAYHGKMIKAHSDYQNEDEILLLPGTYFEVINNFNSGDGLHIIQLKQQRPPNTTLERPFPRKSPAISEKYEQACEAAVHNSIPTTNKNASTR